MKFDKKAEGVERLAESDRKQAIEDLRGEVADAMEVAAEIASSCGLWDVLNLCYLLQITRRVMMLPKSGEDIPRTLLAEAHLRDEALKYSIAFAVKCGALDVDASAVKQISLGGSRIEALERVCRLVNAKFDFESILNVGNLVRDESGRVGVDLDFEALPSDRMLLFQYGLRVERSTMEMKKGLLSLDELIVSVLRSYEDVADLFESELGISVENYCVGIVQVVNLLKRRAEAYKKYLGYDRNNDVDFDDPKTIAMMSYGLLFTEEQITREIIPEFVEFMRRNAFSKGEANTAELRFHYLSRNPYLFGRDFVILSADLILDSVMDDSHYSIIENENSRAKYTARSAGKFIDSVAEVARKSGWEEIDREFELFEGKRKLGDIDLLLRHETTGEMLLVEGKNHSLPLDVYFRSPEAITRHVEKTRDWERKVGQRIRHLSSSSKSGEYWPGAKWKYIVVTKMPEPLSHKSELLILTLTEFERWLKMPEKALNFEEIFHEFYMNEGVGISNEDAQRLIDGGFIYGKIV